MQTSNHKISDTTYGQAFDIVYRDYTEVRMLNDYSDAIDDDL